MIPRPFFPLAVPMVAILLWAGPLWAQAAPELPEDSEVRQQLGPAATQKIDAYIDYWVARMKNAKDTRQITEAREALSNGYKRHATAYYQLAYARSAAQRAVSLLAEADPAKQIQAAMALAEMPQIAIQPALEQMAQSKNAAVRYWAARGYRQTARLLLFQGGQFATNMLSTLERMGRGEPSGPVLAAVLMALMPIPDLGPETTTKLAESLDRVWRQRLKDIWAGDNQIIDAYRKAERALLPVVADDNKRIAQLLADAMEAGTLALERVQDKTSPAAEELKEMLMQMELKLGQVASVEKLVLQPILNQKLDVQQVTMARLQWLDFWKPALAKLGVTPRFVAETTTAPAGRPAATASTAPAGG